MPIRLNWHAAADGVWVAAKPIRHATTNSAHGVTPWIASPRADAMETSACRCSHGEVTDAEVDIFDREAVFLDKVLTPLLRRHQGLKVVGARTTQGVAFVQPGFRLAARSRRTISATIATPSSRASARISTARRSPRRGTGWRFVVRRPATRNSSWALTPRRTLPTPRNAPRLRRYLQCTGGHAGHAQARRGNAIDRLEAFASLNARFYGLRPNEERITLRAAPLDVPERIEVAGGGKSVVVFRPDTPVEWSF